MQNLEGQQFGDWTVLSFSHKASSYRYFWNCQCKCGNIKKIERKAFYYGKSLRCRSCGSKQTNFQGLPCRDNRVYKTYFSGVQRSAKRRNIPFAITIKDAADKFDEQSGCCALTGMPLKMNTCVHSEASLDRIDSDLGYTKDNIQWVHKDVNIMKNCFTTDWFIRLCTLVVEKHNG